MIYIGSCHFCILCLKPVVSELCHFGETAKFRKIHFCTHCLWVIQRARLQLGCPAVLLSAASCHLRIHILYHIVTLLHKLHSHTLDVKSIPLIRCLVPLLVGACKKHSICPVYACYRQLNHDAMLEVFMGTDHNTI